MMIPILAIDPGLTGTGLVVWDHDTKSIEWMRTIKPVGKSWESKAREIFDRTESFIINSVPNMKRIFLEVPQYHGSFGGVTTAASGALVKLSFAAAACYFACARLGFVPTLVTPTLWKGQLPKRVIHARIRRKVKNIPFDATEHSLDALGLALYAAEELMLSEKL